MLRACSFDFLKFVGIFSLGNMLNFEIMISGKDFVPNLLND